MVKSWDVPPARASASLTAACASKRFLFAKSWICEGPAMIETKNGGK